MLPLAPSSWPKRLLVKSALAVVALVALVVSSETGDAATIEIWSGDKQISNRTVKPGEVVRLDPSKDTTVHVEGNLIIEGTLEMKPKPGVTHILRFEGVDEAGFVGGGMEVLSTDPGLWVIGSGRLDLVGEKKAGWNRTGDDPTWKSTDELRVAPTAVGDFGEKGFVKFTKGSTPPKATPSLPPAEVINLTRSVRIEGTAGGRSHVMIMSDQKQIIKYVAFRYMGPRQGPEEDTDGVLGRYPLHFHFSENGSRGSIVEGNVFRQSGNRAVVPHASHGVIVRDNVAYDIMETPYFWDVGEANASHDSVWEHNFAGFVRDDPLFRGFNLSGFDLGLGDGNVANDNAAAGILGNQNCSGFHWPSQGSGVWEFDDNVAHNNKCHGIFVWQNDSANHLINDFVAYRNQFAGVSHGAYTNDYLYMDLDLVENGTAGIISHAFAHLPRAGHANQTWSCVTVVGSPVGITVAVSNAAQDGQPVVWDHLRLIDTPALAEVTDAALSQGQTLDKRAEFVDLGEQCGSKFVDTFGNIFESSINAIAEAKITIGCNPPLNTRFCPENPVTRGQMAAFLVRAQDLPAGPDRFGDDGDSVFENAINALAQAKITLGCNPPANDRFCPNDTVTRGQMAAFLVRALDLPAGRDKFTDDEDSVFENSINALAQAKITLGCNPPVNDRFCPNDTVTRGQMAAFLARAPGLLD